jgi:hypothetical protein
MASRRRTSPKAVVAPDLMPLTFELWGTPREIIEGYLSARSHPPRVVDPGLQGKLDRMLQAVLDGRDLRSVFNLEATQKPNRSEQRAKAMCAEVMRLVDDGEVDESRAKQMVELAFGASLRRVQMNYTVWRNELGARPSFLNNYRLNLRRRGLIK